MLPERLRPGAQNGFDFHRRCDIDADSCAITIDADAARRIEIRAIGRPDLADGVPVLAERLGFAGHEEGKIRLVVGVHAGHEFDVRRFVVAEIAIPGVAEIVIPPGPLFLPGRDVMVGNVNDPGIGGVIVSAEKIAP